MGGLGSGNWFRWDKRNYLDHHIAVDVRRWQREGLLQPGRWFSWSWSYIDERRDTVGVRVEPSQVVLMFRQRDQGEDWREVEEPIALTHTPCTYGGQRVWFVCPSCQHRAALLRCQRPYFVCRRCCRLPYQSQNETQADRAISRARMLRRRLGADASLRNPVLIKPKGMHWKTFDQLQYRLEESEYMFFTYLKKKLGLHC